MSIEIEVGLENAPRVPLTLEEPPAPEPAKGLKNPKVQRLLIVAAIVLVAVAVGLFLYFRNRELTEDAQRDGHIPPIAAKISGRVAEVLVKDNEPVKAGQVLVKIDPRDYQAALDNANAALALAQSEAQSATVDVPRTRETVTSGTSNASAGLLGAEADLARAQAAYGQAQTSEPAYAQANVAKAKANAQLAQADLEGDKPVMEKGEISKQQYDGAKGKAGATASALK